MGGWHRVSQGLRLLRRWRSSQGQMGALGVGGVGTACRGPTAGQVACVLFFLGGGFVFLFCVHSFFECFFVCFGLYEYCYVVVAAGD